jgi:hypothetical protein
MHRDTLPSRRRYVRLAAPPTCPSPSRGSRLPKEAGRGHCRHPQGRAASGKIAWLARERACLLPDWETSLRPVLAAPGPGVRAPGDALRIQRGEFDVAIVPASTALVRFVPSGLYRGKDVFSSSKSARRRPIESCS